MFQKEERGRFWRLLDWPLLFLILGLSFFGLLVLASATDVRWGEPESWGFVLRQSLWLLLSLAGFFLVAWGDYRWYVAAYRFLYPLVLLFLLLVHLLGREALGAQRWISLGPVDFQPSELAKVLLIVSLAGVLRQREGKGWALVLAGMTVAPPFFLVLSQPDLGTASVFLAITGGMLFAGGVPARWLLGLAALGGGGVAGALYGHLRWGLPLPLKEYQLQRLMVFLDPEKDPLGAGWHLLQSKIAIGSGGLWGQGLGRGVQNHLNYLPAEHTDFIFAVIGEELGFAGGLVLLLAFLALFRRLLTAMVLAPDREGAMVVGGVVSMLGFHVLLNIGMTIGLAPVTGVPLPFLSYGGNALFADYLALGLVFSVLTHRQKIAFV